MSGRLEHALSRTAVAALAFLAASGAAACAQAAGTGQDRVFSATAVDSAPHVVWAPAISYPDSLRRAGVEGRVMVQLVIDTLGLPDSGSIRAVSASRPEFVASAVAMARGMVFRPAVASGHKVRVLVQIPIDFTLATRSPNATSLWATDSAAPCTGLTVGWWVDARRLQPLVGVRGVVAPRADGKGLVLVFATTCPRSTIDGGATGPIALGAVIVRLKPRTDSGPEAQVRWSSLPLAYGPPAAPVTELFRRYGFAGGTGPVTLQFDTVGGRLRGQFAIETADGKVSATAILVDSAAPFAIASALTSGDSTGMFAGPEWAVRHFGTAVVQSSGKTILSDLGITGPPDIAALDVGFGWRFTFSHDR